MLGSTSDQIFETETAPGAVNWWLSEEYTYQLNARPWKESKLKIFYNFLECE